MNERKYRRLTRTKKREETHIDYMKIMLKVMKVSFYLAVMTAIIITDDLTFLKSLSYMGAIIMAYFLIRIIIEKIIQRKTKIINHINNCILSEFSLRK